jgi:hypothetical protein
MVRAASLARSYFTLFFEAANSASPAPANVILEVEAKTNGRLGCP